MAGPSRPSRGSSRFAIVRDPATTTADTESSSAFDDDAADGHKLDIDLDARASSSKIECVDGSHPHLRGLGTYRFLVPHIATNHRSETFIERELEHYGRRNERPPFALTRQNREDFQAFLVDGQGRRTKEMITIQIRDCPERKYQLYTTTIHGRHFLIQHRSGGDGGFQLLVWAGHAFAKPETKKQTSGPIVARPPPKSSTKTPASGSRFRRPTVDDAETASDGDDSYRPRTRGKQPAWSTQPCRRQASDITSDESAPQSSVKETFAKQHPPEIAPQGSSKKQKPTRGPAPELFTHRGTRDTPGHLAAQLDRQHQRSSSSQVGIPHNDTALPIHPRPNKDPTTAGFSRPMQVGANASDNNVEVAPLLSPTIGPEMDTLFVSLYTYVEPLHD